MKIILKTTVFLLITLSFIPCTSAIKCRTCLPCEENYKKLFKIRKDEIVDDCGVCITAYSTYLGYEMEGRGCLPKCPTGDKQNEVTPGLMSRFDCCYHDLCNKTNKLFVKFKVLSIAWLLVTLFSTIIKFISR
ncbi:unnamed protein product [Heterobilharzia americana]|nr:unnamed protein product [Heterobilharzia americana]